MAAFSNSEKPVHEGQVLDVKIEDVSTKGDGVVHVDRFVIFVLDAHGNNFYPEQTVRIRILKVRQRHAVAEVFNHGRD